MIKEALTSYVGSIDKIWQHDRSQTVGASEIGSCARKTYWTKKKKFAPTPGEPTGWGARTRGTVMEDAFWQPAMKKKFGKDLLYSGEDQKSLIAEPLSATPDGLLTNLKRDCLKDLGVPDIGSSKSILVECKSIDPRVNLREAKIENAFQVQVQLGIMREKTKHKPEYALISYTDASFWDDVKEFPIKFDPTLYEAAKERATKILTASHPQELQPEGWIAGGKDCEYCPFVKECGVVRRSVPETEVAADPQFVAEITDLCRAAVMLSDAVKVDEARLKVAQQAIRDRLRDKNVRRVPGVVVWSAIKGRQSYDMSAIREAAERAGIDVEQFSDVGEATDRLQILLASAGGNMERENGKRKSNRKA